MHILTPAPTQIRGTYTVSSLIDLMAWDATDQIELINQPLLMIAGSKADSFT